MDSCFQSSPIFGLCPERERIILVTMGRSVSSRFCSTHHVPLFRHGLLLPSLWYVGCNLLNRGNGAPLSICSCVIFCLLWTWMWWRFLNWQHDANGESGTHTHQC